METISITHLFFGCVPTKVAKKVDTISDEKPMTFATFSQTTYKQLWMS